MRCIVRGVIQDDELVRVIGKAGKEFLLRLDFRRDCHPRERVRQKRHELHHRPRRAGADRDRPSSAVERLHLRDHLFLLSEDFLGITGCHPPVFVQTDSFLFAGEKRNAERFFKLVHRSGQRRLCQMKHGSRLGQRPVLAEYNQVLQQV